MNKHLFDILLLIALILTSSSCARLRTKTTTLSESAAKILVAKYQPVVYIHKSEAYFPSKIENLNINWSKATLGVDDTYVEYTYKGPSSFDNSVPIYTSVLEDSSTNRVRISYVFFFAYNGCGPKGHVKAKLIGLGLDEYINVCPADVHWGDIEHIEVTLSRANANSDYNTIYSIDYAYHQWDKLYTSDGSGNGKISDHVTFEDSTHPVVYLANGSHASYSTAGDQEYYSVFSEYKKSVYNTYLKLVDYCASDKNNAYRWYGSAKLLKLNGSAVSGISSDENYLGFKYYGRIGGQITSSTANGIDTALGKIRSAAKTLKISAVKNAIDTARSDLNAYYQATGVTGLASTKRHWW